MFKFMFLDEFEYRKVFFLFIKIMMWFRIIVLIIVEGE